MSTENMNDNDDAAILISGASSGLGLAFLQHYASLPSHPTIIALDTQPLPPQPYPNILFHQVDITSSDAIQTLAQTYASTSTPIKLLLHCAGVRGLVPSHVLLEKEKPHDRQKNVAATESLQAMTHSTMMRTFEINTWGTFNLLRAFLPCLLLLLPSSSSSEIEMPKVIILSSRMGSISANTTGGAYAYRASKAALNAVVTSFAHDVPQVQFLMLHPGRVETGLVEWMKEEGAIGVEESVGDCLRVVERLMDEWRDDAEGRKVSGRFVDRFGVEIAW